MNSDTPNIFEAEKERKLRLKAAKESAEQNELFFDQFSFNSGWNQAMIFINERKTDKTDDRQQRFNFKESESSVP